ncbi:putative Tripeptidyl-peptidase sed1 [Coniella lustricola]|uniref:Putative Tripeptidyl-peptidase sed1 n=1 Tax=Coniella lustricola TaxID=2025994 RepID=A0A2T3AAI8_9PEZI|nr:putative Tripeptidyl-peptidase sed1 [Coniella lustricola]
MLPQWAVVILATVAAATPLSVPSTTESRKRDVPETHVLHERHQPTLQNKWVKRAKLEKDMVLPMRIGLRQSNLDAGHERLMEISNPRSSEYGNHMTAEEVIDFFAPSEESIGAVMNWLTESGIDAKRIGLSVNKQWIQFDASTAEVEDLLYTDFYLWEHPSSKSHDISCESYNLPSHVQEHVDYITPGVRLRPRMKRSKPAVVEKIPKAHLSGITGVSPFITELPGVPEMNSTTCDTYVNLECTRVQYGITNGTTAYPGNELGIFESLDDHYSKADLDMYFSTLYPYIPNGTYPEERLVDGAIGAVEEAPKLNITAGGESSLDFDSAWPLIWPQKTVLYQVDDQYYEVVGTWGFWNTFLDAIDGSYCTYSAYGETGDCKSPACLDPVYPDPAPGGYKGQLQCGVYEPTNVISISYGGTEAAWPDYYMQRQCNEWMKLVLQGTTVVMSSGDAGVGNDGACEGDDGTIFLPDFASTCPYVLSVGSTEWDLPANQTVATPWQKLNEVSTRRFPSGSGFSNVFPVPDYQKTQVENYLANVNLSFTGYTTQVVDGNFENVTSGSYHIGGRAYPDVAAVGDRQVVFYAGDWWLIGGTSLSSPVWGAVLTLINEERLAANKSTLGFIHPILYEHPEVFTDITDGNSTGCLTEGFLATEGWDPVSGLGSPIFPKLRDLLLSF